MTVYWNIVELHIPGHFTYSKSLQFPNVFLYHINLGQYSPTILLNVFSLVPQISLYLAAFERNTTSDWLNHMV